MKIFNIAAAALLMALGVTSLTACGKGDKDDKKEDSLKNVAGAHLGDGHETTSNIRYIDIDTVAKYCKFIETSSREIAEIQSNLARRGSQYENDLQNKAATIQQKAQNNGYLSEASFRADEQELYKAQQSARVKMNELSKEAESSADKLNKQLNEELTSFIVEYNKDKKYDAILYYSSNFGLGSGFYFNPALDITKEVIDGLNARYNAKHPAAKEGDKKDDKKDDSAKK
ncbi:MAG: OmpH family outer membrane protein [Muribaculaceae bacterium]